MSLDDVNGPTWSVRRLPALDGAEIDALARIQIDCVEAGASVGFMHPLSRERATAFWQRVARRVAPTNACCWPPRTRKARAEPS